MNARHVALVTSDTPPAVPIARGETQHPVGTGECMERHENGVKRPPDGHGAASTMPAGGIVVAAAASGARSPDSPLPHRQTARDTHTEPKWRQDTVGRATGARKRQPALAYWGGLGDLVLCLFQADMIRRSVLAN